jgi:ferrous iron transport protein A
MVSLREIFSKTDDETIAAKETGSPSDGKKTLKELKVGDTAQIVGFLKQNETVQKIEAMGLRTGKKIRIMQKLGRGILVKTNNSRIVITSDVAKNIEVK